MALYRISRRDPYERAIYISIAVVIVLLLALCFVSLRYAENIDEFVGHRLAWIAIGFAGAGIVFFQFLSDMQQRARWKRGYTIELSEGRLIHRSAGEEAVEIPVGEIESLRQERGLLIVKGGNQRIVIPTEISNLSGLKRELSAYGAITPVTAGSPLFMRAGLAIAGWILGLTLLVLLLVAWSSLPPVPVFSSF